MISLIVALFFQVALAQTPEAPVPAVTPATPAPEWKPNLKWSGDLRYRFARKKESVDEERNYQQLRARLGVKADVNEKVQAMIRMATATSPITTNQTLGDKDEPGMARRSFGLDLAFIDWKFTDWASMWVGRTANPFFIPGKIQLLWDADLAFEGLSFKLEHSGVFLNLGTSMISENYKSASGAAPGEDLVDVGMAGGQIGYQLKKEDWSASIHVAKYWFLNVHHANINRIEKGAKIDEYSAPHLVYLGNSIFVNDPLLPAADRKYFFSHQYIVTEAGLELKHKISNGEVTLFADYVKNDAIGSRNTATEYGAMVKWIGISLGYALIKKESDSMIGAFTDSDSNGGGTDNEGSRITLGYEVSKNAQVQVNQFQAKRGIDTTERDYSAMQADLLVSF